MIYSINPGAIIENEKRVVISHIFHKILEDGINAITYIMIQETIINNKTYLKTRLKYSKFNKKIIEKKSKFKKIIVKILEKTISFA